MIKLVVLATIEKKLERDGKFWIAFVGDSLTSCEWVHPNWREIVEYVLKNELQKTFENWRIPSWGIRCFNCGYDGATTKDIVDKIDEVSALRPDLIITMIGSNDAILGVSVEEHEKNMRMIEEMLGGVIVNQFRPLDEVAARRYGPYLEKDRELGLKSFVNLDKEFQPEWKFFTFKSEENLEEGIKEGEPDYWHPNQLGNAYIAKTILGQVFGINFDPEKYIRENLAGEKYPGY